jgi:hypothetical protein
VALTREEWIAEALSRAPGPKETLRGMIEEFRLANVAGSNHSLFSTRERPCWVYFIKRSNGLIKIGYSTNVDSRFRSLQNQAGERMQLLGKAPGGRVLEKELHDLFKDLREIGEWFRTSPRLERYIDTFLKEYGEC